MTRKSWRRFTTRKEVIGRNSRVRFEENASLGSANSHACQETFTRLGMSKTKHRNGVLLFFAPVTQQFAMSEIQGCMKMWRSFWQEVNRGPRHSPEAGPFYWRGAGRH